LYGVIFVVSTTISIRNYPIHMDWMEELTLDIEVYITAMAEAWRQCTGSMQITSSPSQHLLSPVIKAQLAFDVSGSYCVGFGLRLLFYGYQWIKVVLNRQREVFCKNNSQFPKPGRGYPRDQKATVSFQGKCRDSRSPTHLYTNVQQEIIHQLTTRKWHGYWQPWIYVRLLKKKN
jgi:hypothetical protein